MTSERDTGASALAEGLALHVERWALRVGASPDDAALAGRVARAVSRATADGHVCLDLVEALADDEAPIGAPTTTAAGTRRKPSRATARRRLLASRVVGTHDAPGVMPLVIDQADRVYLHRHFDLERRLARRLVTAACWRAQPVSADTAERLRQLFAPNAHGLGGQADWQQLAAALALRQRLVVVTGGPGTGKTTTVVNLLACLLAEQPQARIALVAPTGKAAARMTEAIRDRAAHLEPALRDLLPGEASTVHRLLGVLPGSGRFQHHAGHLLSIDALVVDEASMLDLALATRLLEAVPPDARIVLLGDKDQLSAVESGSVFADLSADPSLTTPTRQALATAAGLSPAQIDLPPAATRDALPGVLPDTAVWFRRNFRFAAGSDIGRLATSIKTADVAGAIQALHDAAAPKARATAELHWIDDADATPSHQTWDAIASGYADYLDALQALRAREGVAPTPSDIDGLFEAFGRFRVLCAVREGRRGAAALNARVTALLRRRLASWAASASSASASDGASPWFAGRAVMVLRNDYLLKLYNGDIGIALPDADGHVSVVFPDAAGGWRRVPPLRLPAHDEAWAMTVHKSQGSEFNEVLVLLPSQPGRVLTRELLYTAVTRARRRVVLASTGQVIESAIRTATDRRSGLLDRVREAMDAARG